MAEPTDTLPPRPDNFARLLLEQQAAQHKERMDASGRLETAIAGRLDKLDTGQAQIRADIAAASTQSQVALAGIQAGGLGTWERRGILTGGLVVLLLLIMLLATSRGVDTGAAVQGVRDLTPLATGAATGLASPSPLPAASVSPASPPASSSAPQNAPESHDEPAPPAPIGEPWHEGEGPTR